MDIIRKYKKEVELLLDKKDSEIAALKLRCANQEATIRKQATELRVYRLTDTSRPLNEIIVDDNPLLNKQAGLLPIDIAKGEK